MMLLLLAFSGFILFMSFLLYNDTNEMDILFDTFKILLIISILGFLIILIITFISLTYIIPYQIIIKSNKIIFKSIIKERKININEIKEIHDHGRRKNLTGELFLMFYTGKKFDLHWLSPDVQDMIIKEYKIPLIKKEPTRQYREDIIKDYRKGVRP